MLGHFKRITSGSSKKIANHPHTVAIYFINYNFVRIHQTTQVIPVMEAGLTNKLWMAEDLVRF